MSHSESDLLTFRERLKLDHGTLLLGFSGWMDGGDVSTGTVKRLVDLLHARPFAQIDPEPFYIYNIPGSMEIAALFRPHVEVEDGVVQSIAMPENVFYCHAAANLVLFIGKEPNLRWRTFARCIFDLVEHTGIQRILFLGSFGGAVPHTREPRLYISCSHAKLLPEMDHYGVRHSGYRGPGSFTSYLMAESAVAGVEMVSLVAEVPGYLQGTNPMCIQAVTRRLARMLKLPMELDSLRLASTEWELQVSSAVEEDKDLAAKVRQLEEEYDNDLLEAEADAEEG
jgi:proteasome assembly chaperone (PAC2) family protein